MGTFLSVNGAIFSYEKDKRAIAPIALKGFDGEVPFNLAIETGQIQSVKKNEAYSLGNGDVPLLPDVSMKKLLHAGAEVFVPLWTRNEFVGALALSGKFTSEPYSEEDFELLKIIASQIAITLHNYELFMELSEHLNENKRLYEEMRLIYHDTIQAFAAAIDAKDDYTKNHSYRVARYAVAIARELGWNESDVEGIYIAGLLHDVGKIVLSDKVLEKKSGLTEDEMLDIKRHPSISYDIISKINFPWKDVVRIVRHHHERPDGRGYPDNLNDGELSDGAKILALADSFDAMTTDRPYRDRMDLKEALEELKRCLNTQFDARIMGAFCKVLEKEIRGELSEPNILPHLGEEFDPAIITLLLEALTEELSR
jgi:putative nucleotidyltransferase with HDIG domain